VIVDIKSYVLVAVQFITAIAILHPVPVAACSMLLVVQGCALALAVWAIASIRIVNFNVVPDVKRGAALVTRGPYRIVRHPMYAALLIYTLAQTVDRPTWAHGFAWAVLFVDLILKLKYEEQLLDERFSEYAAYRARTKRLVPGLW